MDKYLPVLIGLAAAIAAMSCALLLRSLITRLVDRRIESFQSNLITKHCDEVQNIYTQMRGWRHDYHNHIQTMKAHLALDRTKELGEYLNMLETDLGSVDHILKTGNVMIDAILNSKLSLARARQIKINAKASVPERLSVSEVDLCVLIGNLLDNAMEACRGDDSHDREEPFIRIYLGTLKGQLYIYVSNSVYGEIRKTGKTYASTKGMPGHGFGLARIDKITDRYGGYVNRQNEEGVFAVEIMLPL